MAAMNNPGAFRLPDKKWLPKKLHPQADKVVALRQQWEDATDAVNVARAQAAAEPGEYNAAKAAAINAGHSSATVVDHTAERLAARDRAEEARKDAEDALGHAWATLMMTVAEQADDIRTAHTQPVLEAAQDRALAALGEYLKVRQDMLDTLGLDQWIRRAGLRRGNPNPPKGGPTPWVPGTENNPHTVTWIDRLGKPHTIDVRELLNAMTADARALDALRQVEARDRAQQARREGDVAAQTANVPRSRITVS